MRVGIDNYGLYPLDLDPMDTLKWAFDHGAEGVQFSGISRKYEKQLDSGYLKAVRELASELDLYLEWGGARHIPLDLESGQKLDLEAANRLVFDSAAAVGAGVVRSCSGGLMRWSKGGLSTQEYLDLMVPALRRQKEILIDFGLVMAIETHFEFTTHELIRLFEACNSPPGGPIGICLDTMNLLTMLEDPLESVRRIGPWVVSTHIKDGGLIWSREGMISFPAEIGKGIIDFSSILKVLSELPHQVQLSVEDHGGDFSLPVFSPSFLKEFPDLSLSEFVRLSSLAVRTSSLLESGEIRMVSRDRWPEICEERISRDIVALKSIRDKITNQSPPGRSD